MSSDRSRESFATRLGLLATMIGVAVGLGNVWRFPYMVGKFGGAAFVIVYVVAVIAIGLPALAAEWTLGRATRRGPVGAFATAGLPLGRPLGWFLFAVVIAANGYYLNVLGWVLWSAGCQTLDVAGFATDVTAILPPPTGVDARSLGLQLAGTATAVLACVAVLLRGLRTGIERASRVLMPLLLVILLLLIARTLTLPGAAEGVRWYLLKFDPSQLTGSVVVSALGQAIFSLSLGGTFMVVYGSYLDRQERLMPLAAWTTVGDVGAGLLAGLAILPAVVALGLEPSSGPGLLFVTLPRVFAQMPLGGVFGALFYLGLLGAAYLSAVAAFEVLVAGLRDSLGLTRSRAVWTIAGIVYLASIPPMFNLRIFVPWDLTFGSGMQTVGALLAVLSVGWCFRRGEALAQLGPGDAPLSTRLLMIWLRWVVPSAILLAGLWWFLTDVLQVVGPA